MKKFSKEGGFTLPELIVVFGILLILFGMISTTLFNTQKRSTLNIAASTFVNDLKAQQLKAMIGDTDGGGVTATHGIYVEANRYTLFKGASYVVNPSNYSVTFDSDMVIAPNPLTILFLKGSGEVSDYNPLGNQIIISESSGSQKTIQWNELGVITTYE